MAYDSNLEIELIGSISGVSTFTQLEYHRETTVPFFSAELATAYAYSLFWTNIQGLLSDRFTLEEIRARVRQNAPGLNIPEYVQGVGEQGSVASDSLPAFNTVVMVKVPDNSTKFPVDTPDFRNGRTSFSGVPEGQQDGGLLNSAAIASWNGVMENLEEVTLNIGGTDYTWTLGMERGELAPPKVLVAETYCRQRIGTQNTRKR